VKYVFGFGNLFGVIPKMRCGDCGFESAIFPVLVVSEEKLKEVVGKMKAKISEKIICPKCKSDNVKNNMRYSGDSNMLCQNCGNEGFIFPVVKKKIIKKKVKKKVVKKKKVVGKK